MNLQYEMTLNKTVSVVSMSLEFVASEHNIIFYIIYIRYSVTYIQLHITDDIES